MTRTVAFLLKGYPRLSETFIAQEIAGLERCGLNIRIISLRHPTDKYRHPVHDEIRAPVRYLPEYLYQEPLRLLRAWIKVRRWASYKATRAIWLKDLWRDPTPNRGRRWGQALVLAAELESDVEWLHAHFLHTPASVARYAAALRGLEFTVSAHAKDIWTIPSWEKREKLQACRWLVTCTQQNADHLRALSPPGKVELVYHGLNLSRFDRPPIRDYQLPTSSKPALILSVGRAVPKKGYDILLKALSLLPPDLPWHFVHIGGGELADKLKAQARQLQIADRITWYGAKPQIFVLEQLRTADIFVLASRIAKDGDQDGLPNVLVEAQTQGLPCISSRVAAIPELIRDHETGLLVPPEDPVALAKAMRLLLENPALRERLGIAGEQHVRAEFSMEIGLAKLATKFDLTETAQPKFDSETVCG